MSESEKKSSPCSTTLCYVILSPIFIICTPFLILHIFGIVLFEAMQICIKNIKEVSVIFIPKEEKSNDTNLDNEKEQILKNESEENGNDSKEETKADMETTEAGSVTLTLEGDEWDNTKMTATQIPRSLLKKMKKNLEPPPLHCRTPCACGFHEPLSVYIVTIEEDSPLLPADAKMSDAEYVKDKLAEGKSIYIADERNNCGDFCPFF